MFRFLIHVFGHVGLPFVAAKKLASESWLKVGFVMLAMNLVDVDHLLVRPIFDPGRCSIGFHPMHSYVAIVVYLLMLIWPKTRWFGLGLLLHMVTDLVDCGFILGMFSGRLPLSS